MKEPLHHDWSPGDPIYRRSYRWVCTRCGKTSVNQMKTTLCKSRVTPLKPTYAALEAEVLAVRAMLAEFA